MSYGVIASKSAQVMVESGAGAGAVETDAVLDRFSGIWGSAWVPGRFTLTRLHANFIPSRSGRGMAMMDLDLRDIVSVDLSGGRVQKVMGLHTPAHVVRVRVLGAAGLAEQVAELAEAARKAPARRR